VIKQTETVSPWKNIQRKLIVQKYVGTQNWVKGVLSTLIRFPSIFVISSLAQQ